MCITIKHILLISRVSIIFCLVLLINELKIRDIKNICLLYAFEM